MGKTSFKVISKTHILFSNGPSLVVQTVKNPPAMQADQGSIPGSGRFPGGGNGNTLQVSLPGESPWIVKPGGLQSTGSQRIG